MTSSVCFNKIRIALPTCIHIIYISYSAELSPCSSHKAFSVDVSVEILLLKPCHSLLTLVTNLCLILNRAILTIRNRTWPFYASHVISIKQISFSTNPGFFIRLRNIFNYRYTIVYLLTSCGPTSYLKTIKTLAALIALGYV